MLPKPVQSPVKVQDGDILGIFCAHSAALTEHQCGDVCVWVLKRHVP